MKISSRIGLLIAVAIAWVALDAAPGFGQQEPPAPTTTGGDATTTTTLPEGEECEPEPEGEFLIGTLDYEEEGDEPEEIPVEDAEITVRFGGEEIGTFESGEEGDLCFALAEPGDYDVELDVESLPDGVELVDEDEAARTVNVGTNESQRLLFRLQEEGAAGAAGDSRAEEAIRLAVSGIQFGLAIGMMAVGLSLIFGTTGLVNFAHAELVSGGAILTWYINSWGINLIPAAVLGMGGMFVVGAALERGVWRPLRAQGTSIIAMLVMTIGISLAARFFLLYIFGGGDRRYAQYAIQKGIEIGPITIAPRELWAIAISVVVLTAVGVILLRTKIGKAVRAVADNRDLAESSGIDVDRVVLLVWGAGGALACLGGVVFGVNDGVSFQVGFRVLLLVFAGVILGGLGTAFGAMVGSLIVGVFIQMSTMVISTELKNIGALAILIVILVLRPQGILGRRERVG